MKCFMLMLFSVSAFAAIPEFSQLRDGTADLIKYVQSAPMNQCDLMKNRANNVELTMTFLERILLRYDSQQVNPKFSRLFSFVKLAKNEGPGLNIDCANGTRNSQLLLEQYLTNVDTELIILQYGVGADLKHE